MPHTKEYLRAYRQTEKYKQYQRKYQKTAKYRKWANERRAKLGYAVVRDANRKPSGFLVRLYRNMKSRVTGIQKLKAHLYLGKELLSKEDFYAWANQHDTFWKLFRVWENNNYDRKLTPTVNRIDPQGGYTKDNMEWLTHSENSSRTSRWNKKI